MSETLMDRISVLTDTGAMMDLNYYVTENNTTQTRVPAFGIKIEKIGEIVECQTTGPLSGSRDWICSICMKLIRGQVTPIGMMDVIEDIMKIKSAE